jgi:hypothetical protein
VTTLGELAEMARSEVYGFTATVEPSTYLSTALSDSGLKLSVVSASQFSRGIVEVGDELLMIDEVDRSLNSLTLKSVNGRGIRGTTPSSWPVGTKVVMSPMVPTHDARRAVEEALRADSGLFAVGQMEFTYEAAKHAYALPEDWEDVLSVRYEDVGPSGEWMPIRRWTADRFSNTLIIGEAPLPGRKVKVVYSKSPTVGPPSSEFTDTGLPQSCTDVIRFSAAWRLASMLEPYNLGPVRAEAAAMMKPDTPSSRIRVAQYFFQMYQQRLQEEVMALQKRWPVRVHFTGSF